MIQVVEGCCPIRDKMKDTQGNPTISTPTGTLYLIFADPKVHWRGTEKPIY